MTDQKSEIAGNKVHSNGADDIRSLLAEYAGIKTAIKERLSEFSSVWGFGEKRIFTELCFCICTPQSKAVYCDRAISSLVKSGKLFTGDIERIRAGLTAVRFPNNKARYIVEARELFSENGRIQIKSRINGKDILSTREWLAVNVKGLGYKEASHFLRNIGMGKDLAILDVHILKNLKKFRVIDEIPKSMGKRLYLELERKMIRFSRDIGVPPAEMDILLWSSETGLIFK